MGDGSLSQEDIDALLGGGGGGGSSSGGGGSDPMADLEALMSGGGGIGGDDSPSFADIAAALGPSSTPAPARSNAKASGGGGGGGGSNTANLNLLMDVTLSLTVELGRTSMLIKDVLQLSEGAVVELDKAVGEELDLLANGKFIGKGKIVIIDDYYGVQITQILDPMARF